MSGLHISCEDELLGCVVLNHIGLCACGCEGEGESVAADLVAEVVSFLCCNF